MPEKGKNRYIIQFYFLKSLYPYRGFPELQIKEEKII
jgi:hypothetical protein